MTLRFFFCCLRVVEGRLEVNTLFPGLLVQTSVDGGTTWNDFIRNSTIYNGDVLLATRCFLNAFIIIIIIVIIIIIIIIIIITTITKSFPQPPPLIGVYT